MDPTQPDALTRTETHLALLTRGHEHTTLARWRAHCPPLAPAPINAPTQLKAWLHQQPTHHADTILRHLVATTQDHHDHAALLTIICCLAPGIRTLATRTHTPLDETLSEIALGILDYPHQRRTTIAAGLLLDARNRLHRSTQRTHTTQTLDPTTHPPAPHDPTPAAQRAISLICQAHHNGLINHTDTQLILHTRIAGHHVKPIAHTLGLTPTAAYQRRTRAEARLTAAYT